MSKRNQATVSRAGEREEILVSRDRAAERDETPTPPGGTITPVVETTTPETETIGPDRETAIDDAAAANPLVFLDGGFPNPQSAIGNPQSLILELQLGQPPTGYVGRKVEVNDLRPEESQALYRLTAWLNATNTRLANGKHVGTNRANAVRWLLQQIHKASQ